MIVIKGTILEKDNYKGTITLQTDKSKDSKEIVVKINPDNPIAKAAVGEKWEMAGKRVRGLFVLNSAKTTRKL